MRTIVTLILCLFLANGIACADTPISPDSHFYPDKATLVSQQIDLLKNRLTQAKMELQSLQKQQEISLVSGRVNKQMLNQVELSIEVAQSNLESINIELTECQQAISRLEKDIQDVQNELTAFNVFGVKITRDGSPDLAHLHHTLSYQTTLLNLEKERASYLSEMQNYADNVLQLYKGRYARIDSFLKSQTVLSLKERQAKTEFGFEEQQNVWVKQLSALDAELARLEEKKQQNTPAYSTLQNEIFYVSENVNFTYLQMLIARYQDQIQQLKVSISHGSSITLLNKVSDHSQALGKQLVRMNQLLKTRLDILTKRQNYLLQSGKNTETYQTEFTNLESQYKAALMNVAALSQNLVTFRATLDQALQQELSSRQGLPGFGARAWLDLGGEILLIPNLTFQVFKSLGFEIASSLTSVTQWGWGLLAFLETIWVLGFIFFNKWLKNTVATIPDHEFGHVNPKWLTIKLLHRNLIDITVIGNFLWVLLFLGIPSQHFDLLLHLTLVWLFFKAIIIMARLFLV